jgi:hypothetical protein
LALCVYMLSSPSKVQVEAVHNLSILNDIYGMGRPPSGWQRGKKYMGLHHSAWRIVPEIFHDQVINGQQKMAAENHTAIHHCRL